MFVRHDELMTWHLVVCSSGCFHAAGALQYDFEAGVARDLTARRGWQRAEIQVGQIHYHCDHD